MRWSWLRITVSCIPLALATAQATPLAQSKGARADQYRVPAGTVVSVRLRTPIDSSVSRENDQVDAVLSDAVTQDGVELIPAGSLLHGTILTVEPATKKSPLGQVSFAFAVVQHGETGSRAPFRTQTVSLAAEPPAPATTKRAPKRQPIDVVLPAGHPLEVTLREPLVVAIPKARVTPK
jgi:hypothetical protein